MPRKAKKKEKSHPTKDIPQNDTRVQSIIASAFSDAQRTTATHVRACKSMLCAFNHSASDFLDNFIHALNRILIIFSRDPPVERLIQFIAKFSTENMETMQNFCPTIMLYLICHSNANTPAVRFRTLQLMAIILKQLPENATFENGILDQIQQAVENRTRDKVPRVRAAAAGALCRMQTNGDIDSDECTSLLVNMMNTDSSAAVRKAALQAIAITDTTISYVLKRIRDVNPDIRRSTYEILAFKVDPRQLHHEEIAMILREGLRDRTKNVRDACRDKLLLEGWMKRACNGNVFDFVDVLGCHEQETEVLNALKVVFESSDFSKLVDVTDIDINNLKRDSVLVLRGLCEAKRGDGGVDKFIPTLLAFSQVLNYYAVDEFASKHLLELCKCVDMSDEAGRKAIENVLLKTFLCSDQIPESIIGNVVRALRRTMVDEEPCVRLLLETLQHEILYNHQTDENYDNDNSNNETDEENYTEEIESGNGEESTLDEQTKKQWQCQRALNICLESLRIAPQHTRSSAMKTLYQNIVDLCAIPNLVNVDADMRQKAMECLGLFCMLDNSGTEARSRIPLFIKASQADVVSIQELALKILVDLLMVFDFSSNTPVQNMSSTKSSSQDATTCDDVEDDCIGDVKTPSDMKQEEEPAKEGTSMAQICVNILTTNLTHADGEIRTISAQGLARLLFTCRIEPDFKLLSRLLIVYHNPATEDDSKLRQCLSVFFQSFAIKSAKNRLCLEGAFEPTLNLILNAPTRSPVSKISIVQVAQFIIDLTSYTTSQRQQSNSNGEEVGRPADQIHERLAESVLNDIIQANDKELVDDARLLGKILSSFRFSWTPTNGNQLEILKKLAKVAIGETTDRLLARVVTKFAERIEEELESNVPQDEDDSYDDGDGSKDDSNEEDGVGGKDNSDDDEYSSNNDDDDDANNSGSS